jgi:hypothetical protein
MHKKKSIYSKYGLKLKFLSFHLIWKMVNAYNTICSFYEYRWILALTKYHYMTWWVQLIFCESQYLCNNTFIALQNLKNDVSTILTCQWHHDLKPYCTSANVSLCQKHFLLNLIGKFYAIFTSPNQFFLDWGIGLVVFGTDWNIWYRCMLTFGYIQHEI